MNVTHFHKSFTLIQMTTLFSRSTRFSYNHVYCDCGSLRPTLSMNYGDLSFTLCVVIEMICSLFIVCCLWVVLSCLLVVLLWSRFWFRLVNISIGKFCSQIICFEFRETSTPAWAGWMLVFSKDRTPNTERFQSRIPPYYGKYNIRACSIYSVYMIWVS